MSICTTETALSLAIARRSFSVRRHGYDPTEVDQLLNDVAAHATDLVRQADEAIARSAVIEEELVAVRAQLDRALADAGLDLDQVHQTLDLERRARTAAEAQVEALTEQLTAARNRDVFAELGDEIAAVLRAGRQAADDLRDAAQADADALRREVDDLVGSMLQQAEETVTSATEQAERLVAEARAEADRMVEEATAATAHLRGVEEELRRGLETAAGWLLKAANEPVAALPPLAAEPVELG